MASVTQTRPRRVAFLNLIRGQNAFTPSSIRRCAPAMCSCLGRDRKQYQTASVRIAEDSILVSLIKSFMTVALSLRRFAVRSVTSKHYYSQIAPNDPIEGARLVALRRDIPFIVQALKTHLQKVSPLKTPAAHPNCVEWFTLNHRHSRTIPNRTRQKYRLPAVPTIVK